MGVALGHAPPGVAAAAAPARPCRRAAAGAAAPSPAGLGAGSPRCAAARLPGGQRARRGARCAAGPAVGAAAAAAESPAAAAGAHAPSPASPHMRERLRSAAHLLHLFLTRVPPPPHAHARAEFAAFSVAAGSATLIPLFKRIFSDHLTPVLAYRCLVKQDDREAPSFLLESVVNGNTSVRGARAWPRVCACGGVLQSARGREEAPSPNPSRARVRVLCSCFAAAQGRYSYVGAQPALEVVAKEGRVTVLDHHKRSRTVQARAHARNTRTTLVSAPAFF
jgi:hypothetical protein